MQILICMSIHCNNFSFLCQNCTILGLWEPFRLAPVSFLAGPHPSLLSEVTCPRLGSSYIFSCSFMEPWFLLLGMIDLQALSWIFWLWRPGGAYALMASRVVLKQPDMYWLLRASGPLPLKLPFDPGRLGQWDRQSWVRTQLGYLLPCDREQVA